MTVTRIEELSRSRCKIYLEDSFAFVLYKGELRLYGVREQEELSEESYREIMQEVLPKRATLRCMNLLQSRAYTESKLRSKLKEGGYPQESIDSAIAYVKSYHYVDDLQFAKDYIANQAGKKSKRVLERDLIARGVSRDEIEAAFAEAAEKGDGPDELALARMWLAKSVTILRRQTLQRNERRRLFCIARASARKPSEKPWSWRMNCNYRGTDLCRMARNYLTSVVELYKIEML